MSRVSIFIDTNVPMYAAGRNHLLKAPAIQVLESAAKSELPFYTSAEVLQEIVHRYKATGLLAEGLVLVRDFATLLSNRVLPIDANDVLTAGGILESHPSIEARDAVHVAVAKRNHLTHIVSADPHFRFTNELVSWIPLHEWSSHVLTLNE